MLKKQELLNQLLEMKNDMNQKRYFFNGYIIDDEGSIEMNLFEIKKITRDSKEVAEMLSDYFENIIVNASNNIAKMNIEKSELPLKEIEKISFDFLPGLISKEKPSPNVLNAEIFNSIDDDLIIIDEAHVRALALRRVCRGKQKGYKYEMSEENLSDYMPPETRKRFPIVACSYSKLNEELKALGYNFKFPDMNVLKTKILSVGEAKTEQESYGFGDDLEFCILDENSLTKEDNLQK